MKKIKISAISLKTTPLDFEGNRNRIIEVLQDKETQNSSLIAFPELCISGYGCEDAFYNSFVWKESFLSLKKILPYTKNRIVIVGLPVFLSPHLYNCSVILCNEMLIGISPKVNLANT